MAMVGGDDGEEEVAYSAFRRTYRLVFFFFTGYNVKSLQLVNDSERSSCKPVRGYRSCFPPSKRSPGNHRNKTAVSVYLICSSKNR